MTLPYDPEMPPRVYNVHRADSDLFANDRKFNWFKGEVVWGGRLIEVLLKTFRGEGASTELQAALFREAVLLSKLNHPHIMAVLGIWFDPESNTPYLVSPFYSNGTVMTYIKNNPGVDRLDLINQIAEADTFLHRMLVVHADINPSNIFVDDDRKVRLGGFDRAFPMEDVQASFNQNEGNLRYLPPECFDEHGRVTPAVDVFSFAMTVLEICTGRKPFPHILSDYTVVAKIDRGERPPRLNGISDMSWAVLSRCWDPNPAARPSMHALSTFFHVCSLLGEKNLFIGEALGIVGVDAREYRC